MSAVFFFLPGLFFELLGISYETLYARQFVLPLLNAEGLPIPLDNQTGHGFFGLNQQLSLGTVGTLSGVAIEEFQPGRVGFQFVRDGVSHQFLWWLGWGRNLGPGTSP